ncbi:MAG TPA: hypothetical protein VF245_12770 [Solirubrobacterales bacterium]
MARSRRQQIQAQGRAARRGRRGGGGGGRGRAAAVGRFTQPHTGREAGRIANAEAGTEYNPEIRNKRSQAAGSAQREKDITAWFGQLAGEYADSQAKGNEAFKTQQDAVGKQLAEASQRGQDEQKGISERDAAFAKLVGGPIDTEGAARIAAAASAADRSRVTLSQLPASEQANFIAALGGQRTASRLQGIEARKSENDRRQKILDDLAGIRKEKGQARVANKEKIREADRAERHARIADKQSRAKLGNERRQIANETAYDRAIERQAELGVAGNRVSAGGQIGAAKIYAGASKRTARATERAAEEGRRGHVASARGQVGAAKIYGKGGGSSGGYNTREAQALLSSAGKAFKSPAAAVNYLVNRGVKLGVARKAVHHAVGGGGGRRRRRGTGRAQGGVHR